MSIKWKWRLIGFAIMTIIILLITIGTSIPNYGYLKLIGCFTLGWVIGDYITLHIKKEEAEMLGWK